MIFVGRHRVDGAGVPIRPSQSWFTLAGKATRKAILENGTHTADGKIYGSVKVRAALEKLFSDKCAYCDSKFSPGEDWNVDHFRPKGRVAERRDHPGYYWLTYDWENLYPSCTSCNQRRKDKPRWGDLRYGHTAGKLDQFPLSDENTRAMSQDDDIHAELTLLIDPCSDRPEDHLCYDIKGQIYHFDEDLMGKTTIEVFHLKRRRLRDRRLEKIKATVALMKLVRKGQQQGNVEIANEADCVIRNHFLDDACDLAGVARAVYRDPDAFGVV